MKYLLVLILLLLSFFKLSAQNSNIIRITSPSTSVTTQAVAVIVPPPPPPNSILFDYDVNGNQIRRRQVYLASNRGTNNQTPPPEINEIDKKFEESDIYSDVKFFPNPVVEILYVQWKNENQNFVKSVQIYNLSGQFMSSSDLDVNVTQTEVDFRSYPSGLYELVLIYSYGNQKVLKIVKQ